MITLSKEKEVKKGCLPRLLAYLEETAKGDYLVIEYPRDLQEPVKARYRIDSLTEARAIATQSYEANSEFFSGVYLRF